MTKLFNSFWALFWLFFATSIEAGNPIVYGVGLCDPHGVVYGNRVFLYCTHDPATKDWWVWSSENLVDWTEEGRLLPQDTFLAKDLAAGKKIQGCWATFGASKNGKYYWYYCSGDQIGVSVSDTPRGPWKDPLGKPLIRGGEYPTGARDPSVLMDDDGNAYLVFGVGNYYIVRLNDDMISQAEKARPIKVINAHGPGGSYGTMDDKPELHKHNGKYYLSWSSYYAISENVYGPYLYRGYVIDEEHTARNLHIERKEDRFGERAWEKIRIDRHGNFFSFNGQWYYVCNDSTQGEADGNRCSVMGYVHFRDNGDIGPVRIDPTGVGQYDAFNARTEAEDFIKIRSAEVREGASGGFVVQKITESSQLYYPRVMNLCAKTSMKFYAASQDGCEIEIREERPDGTVLGVCKVPPTGGLDEYKVIQCKLNNEPGTTNLWLTFTGKSGGELLRLDWFAFPGSAACLLASGERQPKGTNKFPWMSATATSEACDHKAMNVFDGDVRSFWCPDNNQPLPQSLTVDLGHPETICSARIVQRNHHMWIFTRNYHVDYIKRVAVSVSVDGKNFEKVAEATWTADPTLKSIPFAPRLARFVRVDAVESYRPHSSNGQDTGKVSIAELQFVTPEPAQ